jgi:hypothetical protein
MNQRPRPLRAKSHGGIAPTSPLLRLGPRPASARDCLQLRRSPHDALTRGRTHRATPACLVAAAAGLPLGGAPATNARCNYFGAWAPAWGRPRNECALQLLRCATRCGAITAQRPTLAKEKSTATWSRRPPHRRRRICAEAPSGSRARPRDMRKTPCNGARPVWKARGNTAQAFNATVGLLRALFAR